MAVGGLSGSTSGGINMYGASMKGMGGLASGMDTDSMIEGMTQGTRTKISEMLKKKEKYQWQMDAYRSTSDLLVKFNKDYLNITNTNSPYRASFFDRSLATVNGANGKNLTVTGPGNLLDRMKIMGITSLAKDANVVTKKDSAIRSFSTGGIDFSNDLVVSNLEGGVINLELDGEKINIPMISGQTLGEAPNEVVTDYTTPEAAAKSLNAQLKSMKLKDGSTVFDKVEMSESGGKFTLTAKGDADGKLSITGGSEKQLKLMGFLDDDGKVLGDGQITSSGYSSHDVIDPATLKTVTPFAKRMADKTMTFSYNGTSKTIKLPSEDEWKTIAASTNPTAELGSYMQKKMDAAFGAGKVIVDSSDVTKGLSFQLKSTDTSSVLRLSGADSDVLGEKSLFDMQIGAGNRLNMNANLEESGLAGLTGNWKNDEGGLYIEINGVEVAGLTEKSSIAEIVNAINKSDAGVKVNYLETSDKFTITSTIKGASGKIEINSGSNVDGVENFAEKLFGTASDRTATAGQDAVMKVKYDGGVEMDITRDSNSFSLDGTTFNLLGTFTAATEADEVTFSTSVDTDKVTKTIKTMIEDYNKIIDLVQNLVSTKPDRDYGPLTDDEKSQLKQDQIDKLEKKAKEGILFNDPNLKSLSDKLRTVFTGVADIGTLKAMGITVGSSYKDGGKIDFDETKFKAALQEDPDKVKELFTKASTEDYAGGITARLKTITDTFVKADGNPKGILIEKAGSSASAPSLLKNSLKTLMDGIDSDVKVMKTKLQKEIDRYTRQFSSLEQLVSQMNSQSSWLSQSLGG